MTNYERVRDGDIDPTRFTAVALDEASVLRSFGSKTYQTFLPKFQGVKYKLVSTATPSPNRYKELIHYAGYLEIMDTGQALTRFFQRDSTKANNLTLYPHKEDEFWLWVSSWALFIGKPSDLGYDDTGYDINQDELYQQYAKQYAEKGRMAMMDTMGQAAALTGGYASTYGQAVGQQQYDAYLQQLNDVVPELYQMAYQQYQDEGDRMQQQYGMLGDLADDDYSKYREPVADGT